MSDAPFRVVALGAEHERATFISGSPTLDRYLKEQATQDMRRRMAACFIAVDDAQRIVGFYTLASASVLLHALPPGTVKKLPRYPTVPAVRLGRLAVDVSIKGQGLGGALLADALDRAARSEIAAYALLVDALDSAAVAFYQHHGFVSLADARMQLFLPLATAFPARAQIGA